MKKLPICLILFLCSVLLAGQTVDTTFITIHQEEKSLEKQQFVDAYSILFGTMEPTRWLFTLDITPISSGVQDDNQEALRAGAEVKLFPGVSLQGTYGIGSEYAPSAYSATGPQYISHRFGIISRWYYNMPRRIRNGTSANNMSGNYFALEAAYTRGNSLQNLKVQNVTRERTAYALRYGLQRRLFRNCFFDFSWGIGMLKDKYPGKPEKSNQKWQVFTNAQLGAGLSLASPKPAAISGGYCDVLRCFREEKQMWKLDLLNLFRFTDHKNYQGQLVLGYERKVKDTPYSIQYEGLWSFEKRPVPNYLANNTDLSANTHTYGGSIQPRYYFSQKERIAKGKGGNNLSGAYVGTQAQWLGTRSHQQGIRCDSLGECNSVDEKIVTMKKGFGAVFGIQHRLLQHGYVDFSMRLTFNWVSTKTENLINMETIKGPYSSETDTMFKLRAGLAF